MQTLAMRSHPPSDLSPADPAKGPSASAPAAAAPAPCLTRDIAIQGGAILIGVTVMAFVIRMLLAEQSSSSGTLVLSVLGFVTVAGLGFGAYQRYKFWTLPMRKLGEIVEAVRHGDLPVDELSRVEGIPAILVPVLRDLLADLRRQRSEIFQLKKEMSQKVANRTDALERALGSAKEKASRDALTGLHNRRMLDETLPRLVKRCAAEQKILTVMMIDVDYFKLLNDTLGHAAGDELLRAIGQIVRSTIRESDMAFRCGGDEFVVLLAGADRSSGVRLGDRLISLVDALAKPLRIEKRPRLSIGISQFGDDLSCTANDLLEAADRELYQVKAARKRAAGGKSSAA
jgi:diguanylate cyclase (GGDEF)-like protein